MSAASDVFTYNVQAVPSQRRMQVLFVFVLTEQAGAAAGNRRRRDERQRGQGPHRRQ